jgi:serine/threonine protein phosphatase PrpC
MFDYLTCVKKWFADEGVLISDKKRLMLEKFANDELNKELVEQILNSRNKLMKNWELTNRMEDIKNQPISIPNGTVGKLYDAVLDFNSLGWTDIAFWEISGLQEIGLHYDAEANKITGIPEQSGDLQFVFKFRIIGQEVDGPLNEKRVPLIINPNPRSLWKNIDSDRNAPYWKEDEASLATSLGEKNMVIASKRGRSHANAGLFRDDDFAFKSFENGWNIIAVADGAGSAPLSREGSRIACSEVINYFSQQFGAESFNGFDALLTEHQSKTGDDTHKRLNLFVYNELGKAAFAVHKKLEDFAGSIRAPLKELHTTLIFALLKKYSFGYAILTFGVGDCPINLINADKTEVTLMNWLDVGEFGGGTRFITMPEIFKSDKFHTRFGFKLVEDFSYLMMMTDGIYDPKFVVEANLEKAENWTEFINDLNGKNAEHAKVELKPGNVSIEDQLLNWMDFWNPGNHDDRTLAIVF